MNPRGTSASARGIKTGRTWIVENRSRAQDDSHKLVGTVSFGRGGNRKLWTLRERNQPAVYAGPAHREPTVRLGEGVSGPRWSTGLEGKAGSAGVRNMCV